MSQLKVNSIIPVSGVPAGASGGGIVQVVSTRKTDRFTTSSTSFVDITNFEVTITPFSNSNKILIMCCFGMAGVRQNNLDHGNAIRVLRNGSEDNKLNADADGNRPRHCYKGVGWSYNNDHMPGGVGFCGLDDPSTTSALTYKVQVQCQSSSYAFHMNRPPANVDGTLIYQAATPSSLIAMEVAG